jgi:hypothetical protein
MTGYALYLRKITLIQGIGSMPRSLSPLCGSRQVLASCAFVPVCQHPVQLHETPRAKELRNDLVWMIDDSRFIFQQISIGMFYIMIARSPDAISVYNHQLEPGVPSAVYGPL